MLSINYDIMYPEGYQVNIQTFYWVAFLNIWNVVVTSLYHPGSQLYQCTFRPVLLKPNLITYTFNVSNKNLIVYLGNHIYNKHHYFVLSSCIYIQIHTYYYYIPIFTLNLGKLDIDFLIIKYELNLHTTWDT